MRLKSSLFAAGIAAALVLSGCAAGNDPATNNSGGTDEGKPSGGASLTIGKPDGAITVQSNNPFAGNDASANKLGYANAIFEPVAIVNTLDPTAEAEPWLAKEIDWADDYKSVTLTARDGVKWNDGTDFTADDIAFTYQLLKDKPELDNAALGINGVTLDGDKVTITFEASQFVRQDKVLLKLILPKHIWADVEDVTTFTNENPVGTGPYTLKSFTNQSVELTARDDYWGGELAVPTLYYVSYNDNTALTNALANGDADWAQGFIPNRESAYLSKDPEHNVYWTPAGLGIDAMFVNTTTAPFDDLAFRQAINLVIDREKHQQIAREDSVPLLSSVTGLPTPVGNSFIQDAYKGKEYKVDVEGAKKILTDAGYVYDGDVLTKDGAPVTFTLSVPQGWTDYVTGISLIADSVKAIGVDPTVETPNSDNWWQAKEEGDFSAILHWTDGGATPYDLYSDTMDGRWLKPIGEKASYNFGRYDNPEATAALDEYANASDQASRDAALATVQKIFVEDVPVMPIGTRPGIAQFNTRNFVGWPSDENPYISADPTQPTAVKILVTLKPAS